MKNNKKFHKKILETENIRITVSLGEYYRKGESFPTYWVEMDKLKGGEVIVHKMKAFAGKGAAIREAEKWEKEYLGLRNKLKRFFTEGGDKVVYRGTKRELRLGRGRSPRITPKTPRLRR